MYSDNAHLPPEIPQAAFADGAHGLLTPPFTPDSVQSSLHAALELFQKTKHATRETTRKRHAPTLPEPTDRTKRDRNREPREHHKWDSFDSFTLDSSSSHNSHASGGSPPLAQLDIDAVDPLDSSRRRGSTVPAPLDADAGNFAFSGAEVPFPLPDLGSPRRASIDLGGLYLALPKNSLSSPISPPETMNGSSNSRSGWGWAGFDTSPMIVGLDLAGNGPGAGPWGRRGTVVPGRSAADVRKLKKNQAVKVGMFDDEEDDIDGLG